MGAALRPTLYLKGGVGPVKDARIQATLIPYFNVSVLQQGEQDFSPEHLLHSKQLVVYPFRAIGLRPGTTWGVQIHAHGQVKTTSAQVSSGTIEFNDHIQSFHFGKVQQNAVLSEPILVQLLRDGKYPVGAPIKLFCETVLNGECHPSPADASFQVDGKPVIVQLTMAWQDEPTQFLLRKVRSFGLVFPQLNLTTNAGRDTYRRIPSKVLFRFLRNGRVYDAPMQLAQVNDGHVGPVVVRLSTRYVYELGPEYADSWHQNMGSFSNQAAVIEAAQPRAQLLFAYPGQDSAQVVAEGRMPPIPWDADVRGMYGGAFTGVIPMPLELRDVSSDEVFAKGVAALQISRPSEGAYWLRPSKASNFSQGSSQDLHWTLPVQEGTPIDFVFRALKVTDEDKYERTHMVHKLQHKVCHKNAALGRRYGNYGVPCVFSEVLKVQDGLVGQRIAFQVEWNISGITRKCVSAPVTFVGYTSRLYETLPEDLPTTFDDDQDEHEHHVVSHDRPPPGHDVDVQMSSVNIGEEEEEDEDQYAYSGEQMSQDRRLQIESDDKKIDYNAKMAEMSAGQSCDRQPLQYSIGVGLYFQGSLHNLNLPGTLGAVVMPNWNSKLMPLWSYQLGKKLSHALPKALCDGGACDGTLPGCSPHKVAPTVIPKVEFQLSRGFNWDRHATALTRATIAYGMALAPGLVEIAAMSLHQILQTTSTTTLTRTGAEMFWYNDEGDVCTWVPPEECAEAFTFEDQVIWGCTKSGSLSSSGWCSTSRIYTGHWKRCHQQCKEHWKGLDIKPPEKKQKSNAGCFWVRSPLCVPNFVFKGLSYYGCVNNPHDEKKAWCSVDVNFANKWHECTWKCPDIDFPAPSVATTTQAWHDKHPELSPKAAAESWRKKSTHPPTTTAEIRKPPKEENGYLRWKMDSWCGEKAPFNVFSSDAQTGHDPALKNLKACQQACTSDPSCMYVLYRSQEGNKHCATWKACGDVTPYIGGAGKVFIWKKKTPVQEAAPPADELNEATDTPRLLAEDDEHETVEESDSFMVQFHPDALHYMVDESLLQALINRDAFSGLSDGREHELGEAKIIGFKIHHPEPGMKVEELGGTVGTSSQQQNTLHSSNILWMGAFAGIFLAAATAVSLTMRNFVLRRDYAKVNSESSSMVDAEAFTVDDTFA
jgi:hypothetical protein